MDPKGEKLIAEIDTLLSKLNSEYMDNVSVACDMSADPVTAANVGTDFLTNTLSDEIILSIPTNDVIYDFICMIANSQDDYASSIPYQSSEFSHKEYVEYIQGLHAFDRKITSALDVTNEIEYAGNLVNVFENDKKFIEALFDPEVIAEKTEHEPTMSVKDAFYEFAFLLRFPDYLSEVGEQIQHTVTTNSDSVVKNRLQLLYVSSVTFYGWKHVESVLNTLKEAASAVYGDNIDEEQPNSQPYGIF